MMQLLENHMGGCMILGNSKEMCRHLLIPAILVIRFPSRCALSSAGFSDHLLLASMQRQPGRRCS